LSYFSIFAAESFDFATESINKTEIDWNIVVLSDNIDRIAVSDLANQNNTIPFPLHSKFLYLHQWL